MLTVCIRQEGCSDSRIQQAIQKVVRYLEDVGTSRIILVARHLLIRVRLGRVRQQGS